MPIYGKLGFQAEGPERTENGIIYLPMVFRFEAGANKTIRPEERGH